MPITGGGVGGTTDHGLLTGLLDDDHTQYLLLAGRASGQIIHGSAHTGGSLYDIAIGGELLLGPDISTTAFSTQVNRAFSLVGNIGSVTSQIMNASLSMAAQTGAISGAASVFQVLITGTSAATSGSQTLRGLLFINTGRCSAAASITESAGGRFQSSATETGGAGTLGVGIHIGVTAIAIAPPVGSVATGHVCTQILGVDAQVNNRGKTTTDVVGVSSSLFTAASSGPVDHWAIFGSGVTNQSYDWGTAAVTNFYGLRLDPTKTVATPPTNAWGLYIAGNIFTKNAILQPTTFGSLNNPLHTIDNQGSMGLKLSAVKTAAYAPANETVIPCDANAIGAFAINLPSAVGIAGRTYCIKKIDASANAVTVTPAGAETIDGAATVVLNVQWQKVWIISDNANWLVI